MDTPERVGPFPVVRKLGQGGMGVVFEVQDPDMPRTLALKLILSKNASRTALERFWREADVLSKVQHRNVVRLHQTGEAREGPYLVMEKVQGEPLDAILERGPLAPRRAAEVVRGMAEGLSAVHAHGILHRDIKPANVIVEPSGVPILLDFGLAREESAEKLTKTGASLGTLVYMSPEQARGARTSELGPTTDVFSLGIVLYECVFGEPPFVGSAVEIIGQILNTDPAWSSEVRAKAPPALEAICRKAMRKRPEDRYPDCAAMDADLARFLAGKRPDAMGELPRSPLPAILGALVLVLALIGGAVGYLVTHRGPSLEEVEALGREAAGVLAEEAFLAERSAAVSALRPRLVAAEGWTPPKEDERAHGKAVDQARALVGLFALAQGDVASAKRSAQGLDDSTLAAASALRGGLLAVDPKGDARAAIKELSASIRRGVTVGEVRAWRAAARARDELTSAAGEELLADLDWLERVRGEATREETLLRIRTLTAQGDGDGAWELFEGLSNPPVSLQWEVALVRANAVVASDPDEALEALEALPSDALPPTAGAEFGKRSLEAAESQAQKLALGGGSPAQLIAHLRIAVRLGLVLPDPLVAQILNQVTGLRHASLLDVGRALCDLLPERVDVNREVGFLSQRPTVGREDRVQLMEYVRRAIAASQDAAERRELRFQLCVVLDVLNLAEDCVKEANTLVPQLVDPTRRAQVLKCRASSFNRLGEPKKAIDDAITALELAPELDVLWWVQANAHQALGQREEAIRAAVTFLRAEPTNGSENAVVFVWQERKPGAWEPDVRAGLEAFIARHGSTHPGWWIRAALLQLGAGDGAQASETLEASLAWLPRAKPRELRPMAGDVEIAARSASTDPSGALAKVQNLVERLEALRGTARVP